MLKKLILTFALFFLSFSAFAQVNSEPEPYATKKMLIVSSERSFVQAVKKAKQIAEKAGLKLELRGLKANSETGLTFSKEECEVHGFEYPFYIPRGRFDDGEYISVEHSKSYPEAFAPGFYVVIAASGGKDDKSLIESRKKLRKVIPDAYFKTVKVYLGCMH
jgi:hypothetical protein